MKTGKAHAYAQRWCWALVPNTGRNGSIGALSSKLCGFALAMLMMVVMMVAINRSIRVSTPANKPDAWFTAFEHDKEGMREWLHDCRYIYLDVGSNRGIQVRKIFEPDKYPNAAVLPVYREVFGKDWERRPEEICAVGFEANPANTQSLKELQAAYRRVGFRVHFFTETAVALEDGKANFYLDSQAPVQYHQPGSTLVPPKGGGIDMDGVRVSTMDLARYILEEVTAPHKAFGKAVSPIIVMKIDVEGYEHQLVPHLVITGALCKVHTVFYESHLWGTVTSERGVGDEPFIAFFEWFARDMDRSACPVNFIELDDETYDTSRRPLPTPRLRQRHSEGIK